LNAVIEYIVTEICPFYGLSAGKNELNVLIFRVFTKAWKPKQVKPIKKNPTPCLAVRERGPSVALA
jgi:hypothetical protein